VVRDETHSTSEYPSRVSLKNERSPAPLLGSQAMNLIVKSFTRQQGRYGEGAEVPRNRDLVVCDETHGKSKYLSRDSFKK